ncbi:putative chromate transport protein [Methyloligella halotolerans]|uniref:Putative chromate transport protein n=2 Tax=Methyloligella halotolerans TaxID=1177755 RepID=A0A1E2RV67_9HYPH|nr:putative chromate transport protein [Methyloligella halotolerans]
MDAGTAVQPEGSVGEVFGAFLKLGLTSFGGPIAHLGYFRDELVTRRRWLDDQAYADLVALCQFLPGPASSEVGFALGLKRAGLPGALAAWTAFTLPSAILLVLFAYGASLFQGPTGEGIIHGLKLVAVAVVAQAVWGMAQKLCPDKQRAGIAVAGALIAIVLAGSLGQIVAIVFGALLGLVLCRNLDVPSPLHTRFPIGRRFGAAALLLFFLLLIGLPLLNQAFGNQALAYLDAFYRSGALVFGGGHVVLPLLEEAVVQPGWISETSFLAGYGAAQAVPGPLFTFAAYLGAAMGPEPNGVLGAALCLIALFLPGMLLLLGTLPFWDALRTRPKMQAAMAGTNAAVVGILAAALYSPVWTSAILSPYDFALALIAFVLLTVWKTPPWMVVVLMMAGAVIFALIPAS